MTDPTPPSGQLRIYEDGASRLRVRIEGRTVWLSQRLIAELYQVSVKTVNEHLINIYAEGELERDPTIRNFRIVQREGDRDVAREIEHYSLDAILAVGYRVRSARGTAFRRWATATLSEYLVKGFAMDDERLKAGQSIGGGDYFDELLERIRAIRASEKRFYQKITDIYATSIDYDASAAATKAFLRHRAEQAALRRAWPHRRRGHRPAGRHGQAIAKTGARETVSDRVTYSIKSRA